MARRKSKARARPKEPQKAASQMRVPEVPKSLTAEGSKEWRDWLHNGRLRCRSCGQTLYLGPGAAEKTYRDKVSLAKMFGSEYTEHVVERLRREPLTWIHQECGEVQPYPQPPDLNAFIRGL